MTIEEKISNLEEYLDLSNDEFSEYCNSLLNLHTYAIYGAMNKNLKIELEKEIDVVLTEYKEKTKIVFKTETSTHNYKELVWEDEIEND